MIYSIVIYCLYLYIYYLLYIINYIKGIVLVLPFKSRGLDFLAGNHIGTKDLHGSINNYVTNTTINNSNNSSTICITKTAAAQWAWHLRKYPKVSLLIWRFQFAEFTFHCAAPGSVGRVRQGHGSRHGARHGARLVRGTVWCNRRLCSKWCLRWR